MIPIHKTFISGNEQFYIEEVLKSGLISGNGIFTRKCHQFFESRFRFQKVLLTNSCTDALEMCALLLDLAPGDEVIMPSFTFVSTANAFYNFGAKPVFVDSTSRFEPNMAVNLIEEKINSKTKAIVVMHYAGLACEMNKIIELAQKYGLKIIEDAALGLGSRYQNQWLGGIGDLGTFSFHQTKNLTCGEGGLLVINDPELVLKAEIIWEKGTNRSAFLRGESDKYEWVSKGSSFLTSEIHAAFLLAQTESFEEIQKKRKEIWKRYWKQLSPISEIQLPPPQNTDDLNGSLFYFIFKKEGLIGPFTRFMKENGILVSTHYRCLHNSNFYKNQFSEENLINCQKIAENLIRLPLYTELSEGNQNRIIETVFSFFQKNNIS